MLNLEAIARAALNQHPFQWAVVDQTIPHAHAEALAADYPKDGFTEARRAPGESNKVYTFQVRPVASRGRLLNPEERLGPSWHAFIEDVHSPAYRRAMEELTGTDLSHDALDVGFFRYDPGNWASPHLDHREKRITHLFYLNDGWEPDWGGYLRILKSSNLDDVVAELPPVRGSSAVLVRSDSGWHAVTPLTERARAPRMTVQVEFWRPD